MPRAKPRSSTPPIRASARRAPPKPQPDARLIDLVAQYIADYRASRRLWSRFDRTTDRDKRAALDEQIKEYRSRYWHYRRDLALTPAKTDVGRRAKASAVMVSGEHFGDDPKCDGGIAWSLAADILGVSPGFASARTLSRLHARADRKAHVEPTWREQFPLFDLGAADMAAWLKVARVDFRVAKHIEKTQPLSDSDLIAAFGSDASARAVAAGQLLEATERWDRMARAARGEYLRYSEAVRAASRSEDAR